MLYVSGMEWETPTFREMTRTEYRGCEARRRAVERWAASPDGRKKAADYMRAYYGRRREDPKFVKACRTASKKYYKKTRVERPELGMLNCARERARVKCQDFSITVSDVSIPSNCPCCGKIMVLTARRGNPDSPSLDRLESTKGYIQGNIAVICTHCNTVKNNGTAAHHEQIAAWMRKMGLD